MPLRQRWEALRSRFGFGRTLLLRRAIATVLVGLAAVLALAPGRANSADDAVVSYSCFTAQYGSAGINNNIILYRGMALCKGQVFVNTKGAQCYTLV